MMKKWITSSQNPQVKAVINLRERRHRDATQTFLIEGYRELLRGVEAGWKIDTLLTCSELFLGVNEPDLIRKIEAAGAQRVECSAQLFEKISYRDRPDGLLAIAPQRHRSLNSLLPAFYKTTPPFFLIAEAIEKPGNLGTILRSADAAGCDGLLLCDQRTDLYNPNVVRASVGTLFSVPVVEVSSEDGLSWLREQGVTIVAATPHATLEFTEAPLSGKVAIAMGTEQLGLSQLWMQQADVQVRIPMHGYADSLNVAAATTLLLYETLRQRKTRDHDSLRR